MSNTKKEMIDTYNVLLKQLQEKSEAELKPEKKIERGEELAELQKKVIVFPDESKEAVSKAVKFKI